MSKSHNNGLSQADLAKIIAGVAAALGGKMPQAQPEQRPESLGGRRNVFQRAKARRVEHVTANLARPAQDVARPAKRVSKYTYGQAVTPSVDAWSLHLARVKQLEAAVPGLTKVALVETVGKWGKDDYRPITRNNSLECPNVPFTWIELPGRTFKVGNMDQDAVKLAIAACGYAFNGRNGMWGTDSSGNPIHRISGYKGKGVAKSAIYANEA